MIDLQVNTILHPEEKVRRIYAVARMKCQRATYANYNRRYQALEELAEQERRALAAIEEGNLENDSSLFLVHNTFTPRYDLVASTWKI